MQTFFAAVLRPRGASALGVPLDAVVIMLTLWQTADVARFCPRLPQGRVDVETAHSAEKGGGARGTRAKPLAEGALLLRAKAPAASLKRWCIPSIWPAVVFFAFPLVSRGVGIALRQFGARRRLVRLFSTVTHTQARSRTPAFALSLPLLSLRQTFTRGMLDLLPLDFYRLSELSGKLLGSSQTRTAPTKKNKEGLRRAGLVCYVTRSQRTSSKAIPVHRNPTSTAGRQRKIIPEIMDGDGDILGMRRRPEAVQPAATTSAGAGSSSASETASAAAATASSSAARHATGASPLKRQRSIGGGSLARVDSEVSNICYELRTTNGSTVFEFLLWRQGA